MKTDQLLREILPSVIVDNFDVENFEKTEERFDIWLSEKKVQVREDGKNGGSCYSQNGDAVTVLMWQS